MKVLHVLNGEATAHSFAEAGIAGDVAIWREMLSEGPVLAASPPTDALWTLRQNWIVAEFGAKFESEPPDYRTYVVAEFEKICRYADYDTVVFWFEHDLLCQINLIFLLAYFFQVDPGTTVLKQVSINHFEGVPDFKGLGQLTGTQLATLYSQAEVLTAHELTVASHVWGAYAASDKTALTKLLTLNFGRLRYLKSALSAHVNRLERGSDGLCLIESQLLTLVRASPATPRQIVGEWLASDRIYGLSDWNIEYYIAYLIRQGILQEQDGLLVDVR